MKQTQWNSSNLLSHTIGVNLLYRRSRCGHPRVLRIYRTEKPTGENKTYWSKVNLYPSFSGTVEFLLTFHLRVLSVIAILNRYAWSLFCCGTLYVLQLSFLQVQSRELSILVNSFDHFPELIYLKSFLISISKKSSTQNHISLFWYSKTSYKCTDIYIWKKN